MNVEAPARTKERRWNCATGRWVLSLDFPELGGGAKGGW
jgi:hypothetical protein